MTNKEKFLKLVSNEESNVLGEIKERINNRAMLRESQKIALKVLLKLDELEWSQRELAKKMGVSPQQISKIVSGKENLTIVTQVKLQSLLDIPILASYYENKLGQINSANTIIKKLIQPYRKPSLTTTVTLQVSKKIKTDKPFEGKSEFFYNEALL
jgi:transcriptional regulator with XRE-family HTH domain